MGSFDINFVESLVAAGIPRERAQSLTEQLRLEIVAQFSLHADAMATKRDLAELEVTLMREHAKTQERISRSDERISQTNERISQTNERISASEARLSSEINSVKLKISEMNEQLNLKLSQSNERIAETHTRIAETKTETLKWTLGFMVAQTGILFAAIKFAA